MVHILAERSVRFAVLTILFKGFPIAERYLSESGNYTI